MRRLFLTLRATISRLAATFRSSRHDDEFRDELESHLQMMVDERMARGMSEEAARRDAALQLGGITQIREAHRDWRSLGWLDNTARDLQYALRSLHRDPAFLIAAVGVIALGIAATAAAFTVVNHAFLRPLPYKDERRLVSFGITLPWISQEFLFGRAYVQLQDYLASGVHDDAHPIDALTSMTGVEDCQADLGPSGAARLGCARVEWSFLSMLGVSPVLGAHFTPADDRPDAAPVVLLSHALWTSAFAAQSDVIGRTLTLDGRLAHIRGVLPRGFELPAGDPFDLLVPQRIDYARQRIAAPGAVLRVFARLKPGSDVTAVSRPLEPLFNTTTASAPAHVQRQMALRVRPLRDLRFRDSRLASWLLAGSAASIFLIACSNAGFLLLARAAARRRETAIRMALGARTVRLVRQALAEAMFIAIPGAVLGFGVAHVLLRWLVLILPADLATPASALLGVRTLAFTSLLSIAAAVVFALAPVLAERVPVALNAHAPAGASPRSRRLRQAMVVSQIALCTVLLSGAAAMLQTLWQLRNDNSGLQTDEVTVASFILDRERYSDAATQAAFVSDLEERLRAVPGVQAVAIADSVPPIGTTRSQPLAAVDPARRSAGAASGDGVVIWRFVTAGYFETLRIPVVRGRLFLPDDSSGPPVVIVNESLARRLSPDGRVVGRTLLASDSAARIIGVVRDVPNGNPIETPAPEYYALRQQSATAVYNNQAPPHGWRRASILVRSPLPQPAVHKQIRAELTLADRNMEVAVETMSQRFASLSQQPRFHATVLGSLGLTALVLAAVGLYGLVAFLSRERAPEFSVRLALGARAIHIQRLVLMLALRWVAMGGLLGAILTFLASRFLRSLAHGIAAVDPSAFLTAIAALALACTAGAWMPARRAGALDPIRLLRTL